MGMKGKIGLEEHFALEDTLGDSQPFVPPDCWPELRARLLDFQEKRIAEMDRHGIEMMILSLNAPAVQAIADRAKATEMAQRANDLMADEIAKRPDRFQGLAALALQDPDGACREYERCITQLGFRGALANGFSQVDDPENCVYLDDVRLPPVLGACREARFSLLPAPAQSDRLLGPDLQGP
jgi:gamma-resorcylate decarboxylase